MNIENKNSLYTSVYGEYKVAIVDSDDNIVWSQKDWKKNLILNKALDLTTVYPFTYAFKYAVAGTGSRVNYITSSAATASITGNILSLLPGGSFTDFTSSIEGYANIVQNGDIIKFNDTASTEVCAVSASVDGLSLLITSSYTNDTTRQNYNGITGSFTVWKTSQRGLQYPVKLTGTYLNGYCGSNLILAAPHTNKVRNWRTWDFSTETASINYSEVGVYYRSNFSTTLIGEVFNRILFPETLSLVSGQKMRLYYQLHAEYQPATATSFSVVVSGWGTVTGSQRIQRFIGSGDQGGTVYHVGTVTSTGADASALENAYYLEPAAQLYAFWISNASPSFGNFGTGSNFCGTGTGYSTTFVSTFGGSGSCTTTKTITFPETTFLSQTDIRSCGFGYPFLDSGCTAMDTSFACKFDQDQAKTDTQVLSLTYRWRWGRIIS